jgi:AraC-like DNA-binding protein
MVGFERLLQAQPDRDMCMTEICAALDVSERRLRNLCAEHLGMGPIGYDRLRRMSLVRSIFLWRDRDTASVSEVARLYGFRQAGRFSANYRALFGETPSATLRRGRAVDSGVEGRSKSVIVGDEDGLFRPSRSAVGPGSLSPCVRLTIEPGSPGGTKSS